RGSDGEYSHHAVTAESQIRSHGIHSGRRRQRICRHRRVRTGVVRAATVMERSFTSRLTDWFDHAKRDLPWRKTRDPYQILVSEIMLQPTRAQAVIPYYEKFLARFPTPQALAEASESELLRRWAGLGYYQRARHLQKAASQIVSLGGFPREYDAILDLPGV